MPIVAAPQHPQKNMSLRKRSAARMALVQTLYQLRLNEDTVLNADALVQAYKERWESGVAMGDRSLGKLEPDYRYLTKLLAGITEARPLLLPTMEKLLSDAWNKERLPAVMEAVFEAALYELNAGQVATKTVLGEYIDIASQFFDEKELSFVNGVLHRAAVELGQLAPSARADAAPETDIDAADETTDENA